jgi:hypothetical protein
VWYALLAVFPFAIFWVQISHALQYLLFPSRVELNRSHQKAVENRAEDGLAEDGLADVATTSSQAGSTLKQIAIYAVMLVGSGVLVFQGLPRVLEMVVPLIGVNVSLAHTTAAIGAFINIHHFFADGAIWKLSNPAVRRELFAHVK